MATTHPSITEIQPYVAIGPTPELSITVHKDTFDTGFIIFTVIFGLGLLILVAIIIFFASRKFLLPPPPPPLVPLTQQISSQANIGAASTPIASLVLPKDFPLDGSTLTTQEMCEAKEHTIWAFNKCMCQSPYFGPTCERERHDGKYYAVGMPEELNITILKQDIATGKSFSTNSCSEKCTMTPDCIGFLYQTPHTCTLLQDTVVIPKDYNLPYSDELEATLYMKSSDNLQFEGRIFLGAAARAFPPRYWLVKSTPYYTQLVPEVITKISFVPEYTKIYGSYIGIYCRHPFTEEDIPILLQRGHTSQCYIHTSHTDIQLPAEWKYHIPLYVVYY